MIRLSTGLALSMLGNYGMSAMMNYGRIEVYSGEQPLSPNLPPSSTNSTLLASVTTDGLPFVMGFGAGTGALELTQDTDGVVKKVGEWLLWGMSESGVAQWWRWRWNSFDDNAESFYYPRMDGAVGESLILENTSIVPATNVAIRNFSVQFRS
jgi:hypothetical protein